MIATISFFMSFTCLVLAFMLWQNVTVSAGDKYKLEQCVVDISNADDFDKCEFDTADNNS